MARRLAAVSSRTVVSTVDVNDTRFEVFGHFLDDINKARYVILKGTNGVGGEVEDDCVDFAGHRMDEKHFATASRAC